MRQIVYIINDMNRHYACQSINEVSSPRLTYERMNQLIPNNIVLLGL